MRLYFTLIFLFVTSLCGAQDLSFALGYSTSQTYSGTLQLNNNDDNIGIYTTLYSCPKPTNGDYFRGLSIGCSIITGLNCYGQNQLYLGLGYVDKSHMANNTKSIIFQRPAIEFKYVIALSERKTKWGIGIGMNSGLGIIYDIKVGIKL